MRFKLVTAVLLNCCVYTSIASGVKSEEKTQNLSSDDTITLATNISSSFTADFISNHDAQGLLPHLNCVFKQMERHYRVQITPWRRAYLDVKSDRVDGFFTAIRMQDADQYATLSAPLVLENWYWFWREDTEAPASWRKGYKLGTILGSQQETWLSDAGYPVDISANNLPQLIKLLQSKRIDVLLADHENFEQALQSLNMNGDQFQSRFFRYVPLGIYFNNRLLDKNPKFLANFNEKISACTTSRFQVSTYEREHITQILMQKILQWKNLPGLEQLLKAENRRSVALSINAIKAKDADWINAFAQQNKTYPASVVDKKMSAHLRDIKRQENGVITEIIITDARGLNVAISDMTSDYWQGDEDKFTEVFAKPVDTLYFGDINYDESTRHFQVQLSFPLYSKNNLVPLGVMVIGVDVEKILSLVQ